MDGDTLMLSSEEVLEKSGYTPPAESDRPKIIGYRRVWEGGCDYCHVASERLYRTMDLAPIHNNCECGIVPVFEGEDHGLFIGKKGHEYRFVTGKDKVLGPVMTQTGDLPAPFVTKEQLDKEFGPWLENIQSDDDVSGAFSQYMGSDAYRLNDSLRKGDSTWDWLAEMLDKHLKPLARDTRVYRGLSGKFQDLFGAEPQIGGVISDKAFLSTSLSKALAGGFSFGKGVKPDYSKGFLVEIIAPEGTNAAWLTQGMEQELLLERNTDLEIIKVVNDHHIVVRAVRPNA